MYSLSYFQLYLEKKYDTRQLKDSKISRETNRNEFIVIKRNNFEQRFRIPCVRKYIMNQLKKKKKVKKSIFIKVIVFTTAIF